MKPFLIGTRNSRDFLHLGVKVLLEGGSAVDAVEASINGVEDNPNDTTVGYGGIPNILGEVELDASIMDGKTLKTGAVGAVKHFKNPISIAKKLMQEAHHVMLVGDGAEVFADAMGFTRSELLTDYSKKLYEAFVKDALPDLDASFDRSRAGLITTINTYNLRYWYDKLSLEHHGTVNVIGIDSDRNICTGVSTSGLALKFPGRLGDSPIIGAGNYADNRFGGAACTGPGRAGYSTLLSPNDHRVYAGRHARAGSLYDGYERHTCTRRTGRHKLRGHGQPWKHLCSFNNSYSDLLLHGSGLQGASGKNRRHGVDLRTLWNKQNHERN